MPFQYVDDIAISEPQAVPTRVEKWLRRIFLEDWSLKLLSLAIAIVLWLLVTGQNQPVTAHLNVQLNFIRPQSLEISNDPPRTVDVMLTGSRNKLDDLTSLDLVATVDITDQRAGERVLRLADRAQISLPQGIKVDGYQPSAIPIRLEEIVEILAPKFGGPQDADAALKLAVFSPTVAWVAGAAIIIPVLGGIVALIGGLYALYTLYLGVPTVMRVPQEKALTFTLAVIGVAIVVNIAVRLLTGIFI